MDDSSVEATPVEVLLENHRAFLAYLERRIGDRALAEDILQDAFVKVMERPEQAPQDEGIVPWFYRSLRNAVIDRMRRSCTAAKALERLAREIEQDVKPPDELQAEICACITRLAQTLKPEYADVLTAVEVQGTAVKEYAASHGLSATNAGVRVHRARESLKKRVRQSCGVCAEHGCLDCTCSNTKS